MSEQEVTYSELKFHTPTQQQSRQRAEITKNKDSSPLWMLFAVIFGILCLALLVTSGILGALVCRWQQNFSQQQGILENLTSQQITLENQTRELQEILENLTWERDHLQIQNTNFLKTLQSEGDKCIICPKNWIQHGKDCYELVSGIKSWSVCKEYCSSLGSRMLKTDSKEELDLIKPLTSFPFWIGLLYNETKGYWQWEDGTALTTNVFPSLKHYRGPYCATLKNGKALGYSCEGLNSCMCEKGLFS
ncbi:natural killer cells antigen CD94-like [Pangshura tecta]